MKDPWPYHGPHRLLRAFGIFGRFCLAVAVGTVIGWPGSIIGLLVTAAVIGFLVVSAAVEAWRMIGTSSDATLATVFGHGVGAAILLYVSLYELDDPDPSPTAVLAGAGFTVLAVLLVLEFLSLLSVRTTDHSRSSDAPEP